MWTESALWSPVDIHLLHIKNTESTLIHTYSTSLALWDIFFLAASGIKKAQSTTTWHFQVCHDGLIGWSDLLKFFGCFLWQVRILVRMVSQSQPEIGDAQFWWHWAGGSRVAGCLVGGHAGILKEKVQWKKSWEEWVGYTGFLLRETNVCPWR